MIAIINELIQNTLQVLFHVYMYIWNRETTIGPSDRVNMIFTVSYLLPKPVQGFLWNQHNHLNDMVIVNLLSRNYLPTILIMEEILHQLSLVVYPIIYKASYIPGGFLAGFRTNHQQSHYTYKYMKLSQFKGVMKTPLPLRHFGV